jgi:hypothetical protein
MTRRLAIEWPDPAPFRDRDGAPIRLLAVSDMLEPTLLEARNREAVAPVDLIVGCGDLDYDDLAFITDGFNAPLIYVEGNHDSDERWKRYSGFCPEAIHSTAILHRTGLSIAGLTWPGIRGKYGNRSERTAWNQALRLATRRLGRPDPIIVLSHVPPRGIGDVPTDPYHRGFEGYHWLLNRLEPTLWLHGHTPLAAADEWKHQVGTTTVVNVTGAVIIDLLPPGPDAVARRTRRMKARADSRRTDQSISDQMREAEPPR